MAKKKPKSKISSIKRSNQLRNKLIKQGKLKTRRNRAKPRKISKPLATVNNVQKTAGDEYNSDEEENILDMIEEEDISFLQKAVSNKSYALLKNLDINSGEIEKKLQRKKKSQDEDSSEFFETQYEQEIQELSKAKKKRYLLPIKTSEGLVIRSEEMNESDEEVEEKEIKICLEKAETPDTKIIKEARPVDLLAWRENSLMKSKFRIGRLCSGLTENPELKINNFKPLLEMVTKNDPEVCITVKKLVLISILEVFKDLLPSYQIKHQKDPKVKLKKAVKQLCSYERDLLKYYKDYLQKIEKLVSILKRKRGNNRIFKEPEIKLAELGMQCLCDLLTTHPYFNFSKNLVHLLVPFLNNGRESVRVMVSSAIKEIFSTDKRGELSLEIVRNINKLVKSKTNIAHSEVLTVCLSLKIKDVNLDKDKEDELHKKKKPKKHEFLKMSKRERKRNKKRKQLENELLETKAEENKKSRQNFLTEITKVLFTIYFRILKITPSSKLLNAALEGLAKFAHCINIDFYQDLIVVLNNLTQNDDLGYKEKLSCVQTVFTVLYYQGATINIDPIKFYSYFYANILKINAGKNHYDLPIILKTTDFVLLKRRKHLSLQRLLAFTKRLAASALQVLPNGSLALLCSIKQILQVNNSTDVLLDLESGHGQGVYYPEMDEPEYCNAGATSLWELLPLQRHYHPTVREYASHVAKIGHKAQEGAQFKSLLKQSPEQLFDEFDAAKMKFNPAVPPPKTFPKNKRKLEFLQDELENYIANTFKRQKFITHNPYLKTEFSQK